MDLRVAPLAAIFELNTDLLLNCLDGLSQDEAQRRLDGGGNSIIFLAAHLADTRHFLLGRLGHPLANPLSRYLADARRIEDIGEWPTLEELRRGWLGVSGQLAEVLAELESGALDRTGTHRFPVGDSSPLGMLAFLAQHDSYHVGQAAFIRRQLGKPAMTYARRTPATV
ncbi:MAG TPA: DinB family protein [Gemmatimonadales bacterium]|nr:DinB family protein [Gemmatimonadales bacterium]